jgi:hypothetical protein
MKKLFTTLLFLTSTLLLSAQSNDTLKVSQYEYAFIYIDQSNIKFTLKLHYENRPSEQDSTFSLLYQTNVKDYNSSEWFDILAKAFHHMERRGYDQISSNRAVFQFGTHETPYFIFRKIKR